MTMYIKQTRLVILLTIFLLNSIYCASQEDEIIEDSQLPFQNNLARGLGDDIKWVTLQDALKKAPESSKPIFLLIHKTWCGACQNLKPLLRESLKFKELSEHFLMVNLENDEEPSDKVYAPDGAYIPRLLFLDSLGNVQTEIYNENGNSKYKYYYSSAESMVNMMDKFLLSLKTESEPQLEDFLDIPDEFDYLKEQGSQHIEVDYDQFDISDKDLFSDDLYEDYRQEL